MTIADYLAQGYTREQAERKAARDAGRALPQPTPKVNPLQAEVDQLRQRFDTVVDERDRERTWVANLRAQLAEATSAREVAEDAAHNLIGQIDTAAERLANAHDDLDVARSERDDANRGLAQALTELRTLRGQTPTAVANLGTLPVSDDDLDALEDALFQVTRARTSEVGTERKQGAALLQKRIRQHRERSSLAMLRAVQ